MEEDTRQFSNDDLDKNLRLVSQIIHLSDYPDCWKMDFNELEKIYEKCCNGLSTTNGDTSEMTLTVRQVLLFMRYCLSPMILEYVEHQKAEEERKTKEYF